MRLRGRTAFAMVVVGLAGAGLATASSGPAAGTGSTRGAAGAEPTRGAALSAAVQCRSIPLGIDFTGSVRLVAEVPTSVVPGERFTIHPVVTLTADPPVQATPVDVRLFAPVASGGGIATIALPTDDDTAITLQAGVSEPVTLTFTIPTMATMRVAGGDVDCFTTGDGGALSIPVVAPTDGSQRTFDVRATASCTDESRTFPWDFGMRGVAPATVAPGGSVAITFDWQGLASQLMETGTVTVTGLAGSPRRLTFPTLDGATGIQLSAGPAAATGEVRFQLDAVDSALQALNPPHVNNARCTFPNGGPVVTVPISAAPPVTAAPTTTTTVGRAPSFLALLKRLLCVVFRIC